ncbi:hypothetical protein [Actinocrispum sp. NPDC049592]|uniref:hypothetical protein n=1 Tax=Actinocrispum sp. NPDC049592 TaxID=3154835 RepID=UPI003428D4A1
MSTYMGLAWIDLVPGANPETALAGSSLQADAPLGLGGNRHRIVAVLDYDYYRLPDLVLRLAEGNGLVSHAFLALDHDEFGAEHVVLDVRDGLVHRAYHYLAYPRNEDGSYYTDAEPCLLNVPGIAQPSAVDPGVLVDGPVARRTVADRYAVPIAAVDRAADADALAYQECGLVGGPCDAWRTALDLAWPIAATGIPVRQPKTGGAGTE